MVVHAAPNMLVKVSSIITATLYKDIPQFGKKDHNIFHLVVKNP